ncbi:hypothetical protein JW968_07100 [Candidatus Woesearchaeota archaeon]|nr:hypothetical protein [Candidatus Woesearchaeota archaeon]
MSDLWYNIKRYGLFSAEETKYLVISILVLGLVVGYDDGRPVFNAALWSFNLLNSVLIVALTILVNQIGHRIAALSIGLRAEFKIWYAGIIFALIIAVVTRGKFWFLLVPGGIIVHHMMGHRMTYFRYGLNYWAIAMVATGGILANVMLALFLKIIMATPLANPLVEKALLVNIVYAFVNMLPIPPLDGSHLFFSSRATYSWVFGFVLGLCLLLYFTNFWLSLLGAVVIGTIVWIMFLYFIEVPG